MHKTFQNQKSVNIFEKAWDHKLDMSNLISLKELQSKVGKHKELRQAKWTSRNSLYEKCKSLPLMCLKYNMGSLKTRSNDANYYRLAKTLKFSNTKMQCTHDH